MDQHLTRCILAGHTGRVTTLCVHPKADLMLSAAEDKQARARWHKSVVGPVRTNTLFLELDVPTLKPIRSYAWKVLGLLLWSFFNI